MQTWLAIIGSAAPIILFAGGAFALRRLAPVRKLVLEFGLLLVSAPLGGWLLRQAFPPLPAAHLHSDNPGQGVIYMYLVPAWLLCFLCWLVWLVIVLIQERIRDRSRPSR